MKEKRSHLPRPRTSYHPVAASEVQQGWAPAPHSPAQLWPLPTSWPGLSQSLSPWRCLEHQSCPMPTATWLKGSVCYLLHHVKGAQIWVCSVFGVVYIWPCEQGRQDAISYCKGLFFFFSKLLTAIVYIFYNIITPVMSCLRQPHQSSAERVWCQLK